MLIWKIIAWPLQEWEEQNKDIEGEEKGRVSKIPMPQTWKSPLMKPDLKVKSRLGKIFRASTNKSLYIFGTCKLAENHRFWTILEQEIAQGQNTLGQAKNRTVVIWVAYAYPRLNKASTLPVTAKLVSGREINSER